MPSIMRKPTFCFHYYYTISISIIFVLFLSVYACSYEKRIIIFYRRNLNFANTILIKCLVFFH